MMKLVREALGYDPINPEDINLNHMPLMVRLLDKLLKWRFSKEVSQPD